MGSNNNFELKNIAVYVKNLEFRFISYKTRPLVNITIYVYYSEEDFTYSLLYFQLALYSIVDHFDKMNRSSKFFTKTATFFHSIVQDNSSAFCLGKLNSKHAVLKAIATKSHPYRKTIYSCPIPKQFSQHVVWFFKTKVYPNYCYSIRPTCVRV